VKSGVEEFEISGEASRKERDDWIVTEVGSGNWGRKRGDWKGKARGVGKLGVGGLERRKDEFRGEGRGGVRPS
jgi:hypothetical protein